MAALSFISANYVARALNYPGGTVADWMKFDRATLDSASPREFMAVAQEIAAAGFENVDVWTAHCHWLHHHDGEYLEQVKGICSQFDLGITSYAGGIEAKSAGDLEGPFRWVKQLGAPMFAGGIWGMDPGEAATAVEQVCQKHGLQWACENHAEKSVEEMMTKIGGGTLDRCGIALDTGWCGTQGLDALEAAKRIAGAGKLFIVHLKDVVKAGEHETCALGDGIVPVEGVVRYLVGQGWQGTFSIEHEPFDRDPMPEVKASLARVRGWIKG